jgi:hypothetical protein
MCVLVPTELKRWFSEKWKEEENSFDIPHNEKLNILSKREKERDKGVPLLMSAVRGWV